ncbi:MAG: aldose 1-epimerase [Acidobacteria bacterium]|nr:aldose 1-epimerase [Acidobacteriota bacterium]
MKQNEPGVVELRAGSTRLVVAPGVGGSITRYASERSGSTVEWLRPASPEALASRSAGGTSSFPMVPFSNRIRDAAFGFRGRLVQLPRNFPPEPHAIHGHAWREPWTIVDQTDSGLALEYRHAADAWPWTYVAHQTFELAEERLLVRCAVTNMASEAMPVGFGLHPYFVRTPRCVVRADVGRMWEADANRMPARLVPAPPQLRPDGPGLNPDATPLDNNFLGFGGRAVIDWPEWDTRLRVEADPIYACLVVYTPPGQDFFCVEPATNCIDGFNLAAAGRTDTGLIVLEPGDTAAGDVTFRPTVVAPPPLDDGRE